MAGNASEIILHYLQDAIIAEKSFEAQLRDFAQEGDDDEVQDAFEAHAGETGRQRERLTARLQELGGRALEGDSVLAAVTLGGAKPPRSNVQEERTMHNLITAYTIGTAGYAVYEALAAAARAAGDGTTEKIARELQAEEVSAAEKAWRFLPSRSKVAFNMLTVSEVDPSVETHTADNRLFE